MKTDLELLILIEDFVLRRKREHRAAFMCYTFERETNPDVVWELTSAEIDRGKSLLKENIPESYRLRGEFEYGKRGFKNLIDNGHMGAWFSGFDYASRLQWMSSMKTKLSREVEHNHK